MLVENRELQEAVATLAIEDMFVEEAFLNELMQVSEGKKTTEELRREVIKKYARSNNIYSN